MCFFLVSDLFQLTRLDLSFNSLFGSVPVKLSNAPMLQILDIRNNTLSGNVPPALVRLGNGFQYENNKALCGAEFPNLAPCRAFQQFFLIVSSKPNAAIPKSTIPESANLPPEYSPHPPPVEKETPVPHYGIILGGVGCFLSIAAIIVLMLLTRKHAPHEVKIPPLDLASGEASLKEAVEKAEAFFPGAGVHFMIHNAAYERPMSSAAGMTPALGQAVYSASKFALNGYFYSLRSEASSSDRCAELTIIAASHGLKEVWISNQPVLAVMFLVQYMPSIGWWLIDKSQSKRVIPTYWVVVWKEEDNLRIGRQDQLNLNAS
ncbi:Dehydrogenase/reductase SDR family member 7 [Linum grandiflorum]